MFDEKATGAERYLVFRVGGGRFAVSLADVRAVRAVEAGSAAGTVAYGGREVPVIDVRALGWGGGKPAAKNCGGGEQVIIDCGEGIASVNVDVVEGIAEIDEIRAWPELIAPCVPEMFRGVALRPEGELLIVEPKALLDFARGAGGGAAGRGLEV